MTKKRVALAFVVALVLGAGGLARLVTRPTAGQAAFDSLPLGAAYADLGLLLPKAGPFAGVIELDELTRTGRIDGQVHSVRVTTFALPVTNDPVLGKSLWAAIQASKQEYRIFADETGGASVDAGFGCNSGLT
jgi:hypothetical protein